MLEVGGGLGVLSEHLAERARHVHVVELDRRLEAALRDATDPHTNVTLHLADAVKLDLAGLDPAPTKVVANLPYGVAATVILRTVELLPEVDHLGGDGAEGGRGALRGPPGSSAYGPSVLAQLACDVKVIRPVRAPSSSRCPTSTPCSSRLQRARPGPSRRCARSSSRASPTAERRSRGPSRSRAAIATRSRAALEALGLPADARAETLAPAQWRALHERLA